ncbi:MAG: 4-(cytidine 5'-diphospho)-2-C-methyl-D-erythritol kinase [Pseudomonadota bacterium]
MQLLERAFAKINLILRVYDRRPDGFHRIETLMLKVGLSDEIELSIDEGSEITVTVEDAPDLNGKENIAYRSACAYLEEARLRKSVSIAIQKQIFIAAGLGGGSSDAASVLLALESCFRKLGPAKLRELGAHLGSDVPFFLQPTDLALGIGRGEKIVPFGNLPKRPVLLVNPGFPVSTKTAYELLARPLTSDGGDGSTLAFARGPEKWSDLTGLLEPRNDLQGVVERLHPEIAAIRKQLSDLGASISQMSGSGGTVFGLFDDWNLARSAEREVKGSWKAVLAETGGTA